MESNETKSGQIPEANFKEYTDAIASLLARKNANYGNSVFEFGLTGIVIRLSDKINRLKTLIKGEPDKVCESVEDTLQDVAGYAILGLVNQHSVGTYKIPDKTAGADFDIDKPLLAHSSTLTATTLHTTIDVQLNDADAKTAYEFIKLVDKNVALHKFLDNGKVSFSLATPR
jgi:hypothetical protein